MRLLPDDKDIGWVPYVWLIYLSIFLVLPGFNHATPGVWVATGLGAAAFLVLYFWGHWVRGTRLLPIIFGILAIGVIYAPFNSGASVFFIYAAAFAGFAGSRRFALGIVAAIACVALAETLYFHLDIYFWFWSLLFTILIGGINIHYAQRRIANEKLRMAQEEIEHLAKVAERERIARDLHDVLGHTLSLIVLKSELASRLVDRDPARAGDEMQQVEIIARDALTEVRNAIRGYRANSFGEELSRVQSVLQTAGVELRSDVTVSQMPPLHEGVLVLAVREAVTNIVRHAHAHTCWLKIGQTNDSLKLEIRDDGWGATASEGNGLRGMRERIEALGGTLERRVDNGTVLNILLPLAKFNDTQTGECAS